MSDAVKEFTDENFESEVLKSDKPVLVDFWAQWCGPCKQLAPVLDQLAGELGEQVSIGKVNIEDSPEVPTKYGIRGVPTMILFKNGEPVATKVGAVAKPALKEWIDSEVA